MSRPPPPPALRNYVASALCPSHNNYALVSRLTFAPPRRSQTLSLPAHPHSTQRAQVRPFVRVAEPHQLLRAGERVHVQLGGRHISLLNHRGTVYCIDSLCYHAGGPLAVGDIEDVGGKPCLSCPWHLYKVTLESGRAYSPFPLQLAARLPTGLSVNQLKLSCGYSY